MEESQQDPTVIQVPGTDGGTYKILTPLEEDKEAKVFNFEEVAILITATKDEINEIVSNFRDEINDTVEKIPEIVTEKVQEIKEAERKEFYTKMRYWGNVILTSGFLNGLVNAFIYFS